MTTVFTWRTNSSRWTSSTSFIKFVLHCFFTLSTCRYNDQCNKSTRDAYFPRAWHKQSQIMPQQLNVQS